MFILGRPPVAKYLLRRILQIIPTLFFVLLIVFSLMKLIPGDPAQVLLGPEASVADVARMRARLGLALLSRAFGACSLRPSRAGGARGTWDGGDDTSPPGRPRRRG